MVAHEGTNLVLVSHLLGVPAGPWTPMRFACGWASISRIHTAPVSGGRVWSLETFNETKHLATLGIEQGGAAPRSRDFRNSAPGLHPAGLNVVWPR